jgi:adenosine deaminase
VGLDWCGNPEKGSFHHFQEAFQRGRDAGLKCTIHFGEISEPQNARNIVAFRPERVGHATVLEEDVIQALHSNPIPIEICFTSNLLCKTVSEGTLHHFKDYHALTPRYPLAVSTDDKGVFDSELSNEYFLPAETFSLSALDLYLFQFGQKHSLV